MNTKNLVVEFIGTFALIFVGAGAVAIDIGGLVGAAFAHGFNENGWHIYAPTVCLRFRNRPKMRL